MSLSLNYQNEYAEKITDFFSDNNHRVLILWGGKNVGKHTIVNSLRTIIYTTPILENVNSLNDLYIALASIYKVSKSDIGGLNASIVKDITYSIPIIKGIGAFFSLFASKIKGVDEKINNICSKINNYIIPIYTNNPDEELIKFISNSQNKFIVITENTDDIMLSPIIVKNRCNCIEINANLEDIRELLRDKLTDDKIEDLIRITRSDLRNIFNFFRYIESEDFTTSDSNILLKPATDVLNSIEKNLVYAFELLKAISFFDKNISSEEMKFVFNELKNNDMIIDCFVAILKDIKKSNILSYYEDEYAFVIELYKEILRNRSEKNETFYKNTIAKCINQLHPYNFAEQLQYNKEYSSGNDLIILSKQIHNFRYNIKDVFADTYVYNDFLYNSFCHDIRQSYKIYNSGQYENAISLLKKYENISDEFVLIETKYLLALCYWAKEDIYKSQSWQILEEIIKFKKISWETNLLARMSLISIYTNDAQYHENGVNNAVKIYEHLKESMENSSDYIVKILYHVLLRKAGSVYDSKRAIYDTQKSYEFFLSYKDILEEEYLFSLCNYCANLLLLNKYTKVIDYQSAIKDNFVSITSHSHLYNYNNYLIARLYHNNSLTLKEINNFKQAIDNTSMNEDSKILTSINLACFYAIKNKPNLAVKYFIIANNANNSYDDYFNYYINTNLCIFHIICGNYHNAKICFSKAKVIPSLLKPYEKQYYKLRNKLIERLFNDKKSYNFDEISALFQLEFEKKFLHNNCSFYHHPYILSDIQFWTLN